MSSVTGSWSSLRIAVSVVAVVASLLASCSGESDPSTTTVGRVEAPGESGAPSTSVIISEPTITVTTIAAASSTTGVAAMVEIGEGAPVDAGGLSWVVYTGGETEGGSYTSEYSFWRLGEDGAIPTDPIFTLSGLGIGTVAFDSTGSLAALHTTALDYESWPELATTDLESVTRFDGIPYSFAWHPPEPLLAFTAVDPEADQFYLAVALPGGDVWVHDVVAVMPDLTRLIGWGDWGFLVEAHDLTATQDPTVWDQRDAIYLLDAAGNPIAGLPVRVVALSPSAGMLLVEPGFSSTLMMMGDDRDDPIEFDVELGPVEGQGLTAISNLLEPIPIGPAAEQFIDEYHERIDTGFIISPDLKTIAVIDFAREDEVLASGQMPTHMVLLDSDEIRSIALPLPWLEPIVFSPDGRYLMFVGADGLLRLRDWETDTEYVVAEIMQPMDPESTEMPEVYEFLRAINLP